jgi:transposase InsO family protein
MHTDHGTTYMSFRFADRLRVNGILPSMGSVGDSYDNALMENFWSTLKNRTRVPDLVADPERGRQRDLHLRHRRCGLGRLGVGLGRLPPVRAFAAGEPVRPATPSDAASQPPHVQRRRDRLSLDGRRADRAAA